MSDIKPGTYLAKITNYGFTLTKDGNMQVSILFSFDTDKQLAWFGSLKDGKAFEITMKTLQLMGFDGKLAIETLAQGVMSGLLDLDKEYSIKIENEEYEGKITTKIKWINDPNETIEKKFLNFEEVVLKSKAMNLNNSVKKFFKNSPTKLQKEADDFNCGF